MTLPVRIVTQLLVGAVQPQAQIARCVMARVVVRRADRARHQALAAKLVKRCAQVRIPRRKTIELRYGQRATVAGTLQTVDGTPIPDAGIQITQQATGWTTQQAGQVTTNSHGRFTYTLPWRLEDGDVLLPGHGDAALQQRIGSVAVQGKATFSITTKRAVAGRPLRMSGRVFGGYIPPGGVLVQLWFSDHEPDVAAAVSRGDLYQQQGVLEHELPAQRRGTRPDLPLFRGHRKTVRLAVRAKRLQRRHPARKLTRNNKPKGRPPSGGRPFLLSRKGSRNILGQTS